jgi:hypothetical protein
LDYSSIKTNELKIINLLIFLEKIKILNLFSIKPGSKIDFKKQLYPKAISKIDQHN